MRRGLLDKCVVIAEKPGWSSLKSALSDCPKRLTLLPVRGIDSEFGEGEEAGPFGETDTDGVGVNLVEAVDFHAALSRGGAAEDCVPGAFVEIFNDIFLHHASLWFGHHDHIDEGARVELDFPERFFDFGAGDPACAEVVIVGEIHDVHVVGPGGVARLADGDVDVGDRLHCLGHVHDVAGVLPNLAYALQRVDAILIHQAVTVRGGVQDVGAVGVVVRDDVLGHDLVNILQGRARELGLPEPGLLQRVAGHRRELVCLRGDLLAGALLVATDVRIEQRLGRVLRPVQIHHQAVRLDALDEMIKLWE